MVFFVKFLSKLPFPIIYFLSDVLYLILFKMIGYRKDVINTNLKNSFPEKSEEELKKISDTFCRYLCDLILEGIKIHAIPKEELLKRMEVVNPEEVNNWYDKGKSTIVVLGHYGNWEFGALAFSTMSKHKLKIIYKPLTNKGFDKFMKDARSRFGGECIPYERNL